MIGYLLMSIIISSNGFDNKESKMKEKIRYFDRYHRISEYIRVEEALCPKCRFSKGICSECLCAESYREISDLPKEIPNIEAKRHFLTKGPPYFPPDFFSNGNDRNLNHNHHYDRYVYNSFLLEYINTTTGTASENYLIDILRSSLDEFSDFCPIETLSGSDFKLKRNKFADFVDNYGWNSVVGSLKDRSKFKYKEDVRLSKQINFGPEVVSKLSDYLLPIVKEELDRQFIDYLDVKFEPSHGNIIHYRKGGKFELHRDAYVNTLNENADRYNTFENDFKKTDGKSVNISVMYTMLICLDCNLENRFFSDEGNTVVYLPSGNHFMSNDHRDGRHAGNAIVETFPHIFNQSCIPGEWLIFPSEARHASIKIESEDCYKCILKLDLHISYKSNYMNTYKIRDKINDRFDDIFISMGAIPSSVDKISDIDHYSSSAEHSVDTFFNKLENRFMSSMLCNCKLCDKSKALYMVYSKIIDDMCKSLISRSLQEDNLFLIMDYLMDNSHQVICPSIKYKGLGYCLLSDDDQITNCPQCEFKRCQFMGVKHSEVFLRDYNISYNTRLGVYENWFGYGKRNNMRIAENHEYNILLENEYDYDSGSDCNGN